MKRISDEEIEQITRGGRFRLKLSTKLCLDFRESAIPFLEGQITQAQLEADKNEYDELFEMYKVVTINLAKLGVATENMVEITPKEARDIVGVYSFCDDDLAKSISAKLKPIAERDDAS